MKTLRWNKKTETLDTLFGGRLKVLQNKKGYRFSIDALLLAHFARPRRGERIIELGTGCGVVPAILTCGCRPGKVVGVEIQPSLADLARRNMILNRVSSRVKIWEKDLKTLDGKRWKEGFDLVISNPPYRKVGSGRINPREEKALARHEIQATLEDLLRAAHHLLSQKGRLVMIYPAFRTADLIREMARFRFEPKRLQFVHSREGEEARLITVEALKGGGIQVRVLAPLFLYDRQGYTPAARRLFSPPAF
jgi:tRNA1Val (adenine37-N6)-methyltransferase